MSKTRISVPYESTLIGVPPTTHARPDLRQFVARLDYGTKDERIERLEAFRKLADKLGDD